MLRHSDFKSLPETNQGSERCATPIETNDYINIEQTLIPKLRRILVSREAL